MIYSDVISFVWNGSFLKYSTSLSKELDLLLILNTQKVNRPSETKRRFACDSAVAVVKVVFAVKFNKVFEISWPKLSYIQNGEMILKFGSSCLIKP